MAETPFLFDEGHELFRDSVRRLAETEFAGGYLERATQDKFPRAECEILARNGLLGVLVPEEFGGQGSDAIALGICLEELAKVDFTLSYLPFAGALAARLIALMPDTAVRAKWLEAVASGESLAALALTEPGAGSHNAGMTCRAVACEGGWRLEGEKTSMTLAGPADAALVFAKTSPNESHRSIACFLVADLDDSSIARQTFVDPGWRPLGRGSVTFDGTFVPEEHLVTPSGGGLSSVLKEFELTRPALALMCIGTAETALRMAGEYAKQRQAFGQPISRFQGVSFVLAEHETKLEAARWLCYRSLGLTAAGRPAAKEAAMCKWWVPQIATQAINDAVVIHGHVGWSDEMPLMQMLRDVSGLQVGDGTPQIQKLIIARELLGREFTG